MKVAFLECLSSRDSLMQSCKEFCKRHIIGGASITRDTLAGALGRPLTDAVSLRGGWRSDFDLAAISFNTPGSPRAYRAARELKALGKTVMAGGPHPSALPDEALECFDSVCVGPGDSAFSAMVNDAEHGQLRPVYHGARGDWAVPWRGTWPRFSLVQTSRGCGGQCRFCAVATLSPDGVDARPLEDVASELARTPRLISIVDDNFLADPVWAHRVAELLRREGKRFVCQVTPEAVLCPGNLENLAASGCALVGVGIESVSPRSREFLGKPPGWDPKEVVRSVQEAGMACYVNLVFGSDGETPEIFQTTLDFVEQARPAIVSPHLLTPFPGTRLYAYLAERGRLLYGRDALPEARDLRA